MTALGGIGAAVDDATIAVDAREALANAPGGTLHVDGVGHVGDDCDVSDVSFHDDDGVPTFFAPSDAPVARAARQQRSAVLSVPAGTSVPDATGLILAGRLCVTRHHSVEGEPVVVVALQVHTVLLERDDHALPSVAHRVVPLASWTAARPDVLRGAARRIAAHTNDAHGATLRRYVAGLRAVGEDDILAAGIAHLDAAGVDLDWVDASGAHRARIRFAEPADCPGTLAARLRETLTG